jgi:hypothetical protein
MAQTRFSGPVASDNGFLTTISNSSTGSTTFNVSTTEVTMTGAGGTGGRTLFKLNTNAALGSFTNALKAEVVYGASGRTTGLGSAFVAEMTLSAGTSAGTYAPVEIELNMGASASTGTTSSLLFASVNGESGDRATFDSNGFIMNIAGLTTGAAKAFGTPGGTFASANTGIGGANARGLKVKIGTATFYLAAVPAATFEA